jgi:hypothetical protein
MTMLIGSSSRNLCPGSAPFGLHYFGESCEPTFFSISPWDYGAASFCLVASVGALMVAVTIRLRLPLVLVTWSPILHFLFLLVPPVLWELGLRT